MTSTDSGAPLDPAGRNAHLVRRTLCASCRLLSVLGLMIGSTVPAMAQDRSVQKRVLTVFSTRRDSGFSIAGANDLPRTLDRKFDRRIDFYSEFADDSRFLEPSYRDGFRDLL